MNKTLLLVGDSEGGMLRNGKLYSLHDLSFALVGIAYHNVSTNLLSNIEMFNPFSFISWSAPTHQKYNDSKSIQKKVITPLKYFLEYYECDTVMFGFWGAHHDKHILDKLLVSKFFDSHYLDFLKLVKEIDKVEHKDKPHKMLKEYKLNSVMKHYASKEKKDKSQTHTAYGDTIDLIKILKCFMQDIEHKKPTKNLQNVDKWLKKIYSRPEIQLAIIEEKNEDTKKGTSSDYTQPVCYSFSYCCTELRDLIAMDQKANDYLWLEGELFKIRKKWQKHEEKNFKGYGLYYLSKSNEFKLIKNQEVKKEILVNKEVKIIPLPKN